MSREIKFRFVLECDGDLYYSKVVKNMNEIIKHTYLLEELIDDGGCNQGNIAFNDAFINRDWIIKHTPEYTGLKDKNGVEIYEGDIVNAWSEGSQATLEVKWGVGTAGFFLFRKHGCIIWKLSGGGKDYTQETVEVIGNIYENSELLKDK